ncbi:MAG: HEAT repeat domain-containing protein [Myxococcales bacterium]|nr:HEAT repeat domain-containing protein [Myxococcales bacterium]MCB9643126.1 HEAT repeat domain-containing protein [Myxococcales bacterium]
MDKSSKSRQRLGLVENQSRSAGKSVMNGGRPSFGGASESAGRAQTQRSSAALVGVQTRTRAPEVAPRGQGSAELQRRREHALLIMRLNEQRRREQQMGCYEVRVRRREPGLEPLRFQALFGQDVQTRLEALEGLVELQPHAAVTYSTLHSVLEERQQAPELRVKALELLANYPPPLEEDQLMELMIASAWDKEITVRKAATRALAAHPDPRSIGPLMGLLGTKDPELRRLAESSLSKIAADLGPPPERIDGDA